MTLKFQKAKSGRPKFQRDKKLIYKVEKLIKSKQWPKRGAGRPERVWRVLYLFI